MKNIRIVLSENFPFLGGGLKFSIYLNRRVFVIIAAQLFCMKCQAVFSAEN